MVLDFFRESTVTGVKVTLPVTMNCARVSGVVREGNVSRVTSGNSDWRPKKEK